MMLKKISGSFKKDQRQMSQPTPADGGSDSHFYCFSVPRLFLGSSPKGLSDSDSMKSPTSPLDRVFSNLDQTLRLPPSPGGESRKNWDFGKVGLGIIDILGEDMKDSEKVFPLSDSKNILFGPQIRTMTHNSRNPSSYFLAPNSLPKISAIFSHTQIGSPLRQANSDVLFEIGEAALEPEHFQKFRACSLDSSPQFAGGSLNSNKIELSEDYTCVISRGSNPKTTHIYSDCVLECHSTEFLSFCYCCNKILEEGKDIYIYRGEKAFCSLDCRSKEIMIDEELEKSKSMSCDNCFGPENGEELFEV